MLMKRVPIPATSTPVKRRPAISSTSQNQVQEPRTSRALPWAAPATSITAAIPANRPDVGIIHAQKADRKGNVLMWGLVGVQKETVLAARRSIVTVEEVVDRLDAPPNAVVLPHWAVGAVCEVKGGAFPSYAHGYYARANAFYKHWDDISRERATFQAWMQRHVIETGDFAEFRRTLDAAIVDA
jgi:glutaconate CoA-transferase subunit A